MPIGYSAIAKAAPDGHTLGTIYFELSAYKWLGHSDVDDTRFLPITRYNADPARFEVNAALLFQTLAETLYAIKTDPFADTMRSGNGMGSVFHLAADGQFQSHGSTDSMAVGPGQGAVEGTQTSRRRGGRFRNGFPSLRRAL